MSNDDDYRIADARHLESLARPKALSPATKIAAAYSHFALALQLSEAIDKGRITPRALRTNIEVLTGDVGDHDQKITFCHPWTTETLRGQTRNIVFGALALTSISIDSALDEACKSKRDPFDVSDAGSARNIMYMVRCAFAHGPMEPKWQCFQKYQRVYTVRRQIPKPSDGTTKTFSVTFDGAARNGETVMPWHFGGYEGYGLLMNYCHELAERST